ncbi:hypothetical protein Tco_1400656 [Tanacetum coccineum]
MMRSFCEMVIQRKQVANIDQPPPQEMSIQDMEDLKQHYLDEMLSLSKFNGMRIEINKKKELQRLEQEQSVTFSNPLFDSNDDFTSSDDESLSDEDVLEDNVKIYSNPLFEFDDEYISSDVNPLFDEVLEDIESKDSYISNLDEPALLVTPLSDDNEDECFYSGGEIDEMIASSLGGGGEILGGGDVGEGGVDDVGDLEALEMEALVDAMEVIPNCVRAFWAKIAETRQGGLSCKESFIGLFGRGRHLVVMVVEWIKRVKIGGPVNSDTILHGVSKSWSPKLVSVGMCQKKVAMWNELSFVSKAWPPKSVSTRMCREEDRYMGQSYHKNHNSPSETRSLERVMAAPIISVLFDSSASSHAPRVILFGAIPAIIPIIPEVPIVPTNPIVAPKVGVVSVVSPAGVLDLVDYSSSLDSDPSEDSLPLVSDLPLVSPFLCSDDLEADNESEPAEQRPERHESLAAHDAMVSSEAIPFSRPYHTHLNGPCKLLTVRKRVGPVPARRLAWRHVSHHSSDHHSSSDSSSSGSSSDSSFVRSSRYDSSGQAHSGPSTRVVSPRLVYPPVRTPHCSEAFMHWRSAPLSTLYPPTTSESSLGSSSERSLDSSLPSFGPSRKRCRSPTASVPSPTHGSRSIAPTPANLLPPRKRFRDSYSPEDNEVESIEDGVSIRVEIAASDLREDDEEFEAEASATDMREIVVDPLAIGDSSESSRGGIPDPKDTIHDIVHYMPEVYIDRITEIETAQRQLEADQLIASKERASLVERTRSLEHENLKVRALLSIERDRVDSLRWHMELLQEEFCQVRKDRDDTRRRLRRTMTITRSGMTPEAIQELVNRRVEEALAAYEVTRAANALDAENQR